MILPVAAAAFLPGLVQRLGAQPNTLSLFAASPPGPAPVSVNTFGSPGNTTLFYWVVARYPVGRSGVTGPWSTSFANATLSANNGVLISWTALPDATGYDVLKTTTAIPPVPGTCTCALAINTPNTTVSDTGGALSAYTFTNPQPSVTAGITLNNRSFTAPQFVFDRGVALLSGGIRFPDGTSQLSAAGAPASNLNDPGGNGIVVRNAPTLTVNRSMAATLPLTIANADGTAGNPTYACPTCVTAAAALTLNGVLIGGGGQAASATAAGAADQIFRVGGGGGAPAFGSIDLSKLAAVGASILSVGNGGTGISSATANGVVLGAGGGTPLSVTAAGSADQVFRVPGGGGAPAFGAIALNQAAAVTGVLATANGGTGAATLVSRVHDVCTGTASAAATLFITQYGTAACTNTTESFNQQILAPSAGTLRNLQVRCGTAGVNASSGVVTGRINGANTTVTCTVGTGTTCSDTTHTAAVVAGDRITLSVATQAGETLANCLFSYEY